MNIKLLNNNYDDGSALVIALVMLVVLTLMAITGMQSTSIQERMAGNMRDKNLAFQAAEAVLREAESFLQSAVLPPFNGTNGLYQAPNSDTTAVPLWQTVDWASENATWGYEMTVDNVTQNPRYIIEELPPVPEPTASLAADEPIPDAGMYRITSWAVGGTEGAEVLLQTTYKR